MDELTVELRSFLDQRRCGVLATHNSGGTIHLTPIWFLFEGGCFYFESPSTSRKVKNVEQSPSASVATLACCFRNAPERPTEEGSAPSPTPEAVRLRCHRAGRRVRWSGPRNARSGAGCLAVGRGCGTSWPARTR